MKMHRSITVDRVADAVEQHMTSLDDNPGFCIACGDDAERRQARRAQLQV
jgi:hypothetical protein